MIRVGTTERGVVESSECAYCRFAAMCLPTSWKTIEENLFKCGGCGAFFFATDVRFARSGATSFSRQWARRVPEHMTHVRLPTCLLARLFSKHGLQAEVLSSDVCPLCRDRIDDMLQEKPVGRRPWKKPHVQMHRV